METENRPMSTSEAMWRGSLDRMQRARLEARKTGDRGDFISAHSIMLSAYISVQHEHPMWYTVLALPHSIILLWQWKKLNHNQLDVLIQFLLKVRSRIPFIKTGQLSRKNSDDVVLLRLSEREVDLAHETKAKPHQVALACMTYAEVRYAVDFRHNDIVNCVSQVLSLEKDIRREKDQPQGLRQLVRILRKVGEMYINPEMRDLNKARFYLRRARVLAEGEANTPDQARKILTILQEITLWTKTW